MLTEEDKVRARHHLGYPAIEKVGTFQAGFPSDIQTNFVTERAFVKILPSSEAFFRQLLDRLDGIECQMLQNQGNLAVESLGEITINKNEFKMLIMQYRHWQGALANMLQVPPNPFDQREFLGMGYGGTSGINVGVSS